MIPQKLRRALREPAVIQDLYLLAATVAMFFLSFLMGMQVDNERRESAAALDGDSVDTQILDDAVR